ncbi:hypothetical protein MMC30_002056 [Trapelia coarctata]|nr:hypothetical protein [Trapelia coarctata]
MAYYNQVQREQAIYADATQRVFPGQQPQQQQFYPGNIPLHHPSQSHGYLHQQPQYGGYSGEAMSMPPPSTTGAAMTGGTMQLGISQRPPSAPYQAHMQNNPQNHSAYLPSQANFPPQTAQSFYPQSNPPIPSPTHSQAPSTTSISPVKQAMAAAPPPGQSPQSAQQKQQQQQQQFQLQQQRPLSSSSQTPQKPILQPPLSPASQKLETQRVTALLEINRVLLYEMTQLQAAGRFGPLYGQPQQPGQASPGGGEGDGEAAKAKGPVQSREYIECMRRLQSNLAYLAFTADRAYKPADQIPRFPAIMEPPTSVPGNMISDESMAELNTMYEKMKELFPAYSRSKGESGSNPLGGAQVGGGSGMGSAGGTPVGQGQGQNIGNMSAMAPGLQSQGHTPSSQAQAQSGQVGQTQSGGGTSAAVATTA